MVMYIFSYKVIFAQSYHTALGEVKVKLYKQVNFCFRRNYRKEKKKEFKQVTSFVWKAHYVCFYSIYTVNKGFPRKLLPNSFSLSVTPFDSHSLCPLPLPSLHSQLLLRECQH